MEQEEENEEKTEENYGHHKCNTKSKIVACRIVEVEGNKKNI